MCEYGLLEGVKLRILIDWKLWHYRKKESFILIIYDQRLHNIQMICEYRWEFGIGVIFTYMYAILMDILNVYLYK